MRYLFLGLFTFFTLSGNAQSKHGDSITKNGVKFVYVDQMPEPGYDINKYLSENIHYPKKARMHNIEGRVIVRFVVGEIGNIYNCEVVKGFDKRCDEEALRVVKSMPPWKPGKRNGAYVEVFYNLPIVFKLD